MKNKRAIFKKWNKNETLQFYLYDSITFLLFENKIKKNKRKNETDLYTCQLPCNSQKLNYIPKRKASYTQFMVELDLLIHFMEILEVDMNYFTVITSFYGGLHLFTVFAVLI